MASTLSKYCSKGIELIATISICFDECQVAGLQGFSSALTLSQYASVVWNPHTALDINKNTGSSEKDSSVNLCLVEFLKLFLEYISLMMIVYMNCVYMCITTMIFLLRLHMPDIRVHLYFSKFPRRHAPDPDHLSISMLHCWYSLIILLVF